MRLKTIAAAVALGLASFAAQAEDNSGKIYVVGSVGLAKYDISDVEDEYNADAAVYNSFPGVTASVDITDSDVTFAVGAGFQFNQYVAAEVFYRSYGEAEASVYATDGVNYETESQSLKSSGLGIGVIGSIPVTPDFSVYGRLDAVNLKSEYELSADSSFVGSDSGSIDDTKVKLGLGLGAQYAFGSGFALRAEYQRIEAEIEVDGESGTSDINSLSVSVLKAF